MHLSFDMIYQETNIQILESKALHIPNRCRFLIGQILLVVNSNEISGERYVYIQYRSSLSMHIC